jgi:hypothetical protein
VRLDAETVKRSALSLERVDDVESSDGLSLGVLRVSDRVSDDVWEERRGANGKEEELLTLKEDLEDTSSLLVDQARDTLDTSSSCETSDGGLGDALAVKGERKKGRVSKGCSSR